LHERDVDRLAAALNDVSGQLNRRMLIGCSRFAKTGAHSPSLRQLALIGARSRGTPEGVASLLNGLDEDIFNGALAANSFTK
jgi:hypothetical protein